MHITIFVVMDRDYTIVIHSGTETQNGAEVEYVNRFYVMKKLEPAKCEPAK